MSQFEQMKNAAEELRSRIEKILSVDRKKLYGTDRWGDISFEEHGKDQILLHAATAIFANTPTAFSKDKEIPLSPAIEIIKRGACSMKSKSDT